MAHKTHRPGIDPVAVYGYMGPIEDAARPNPRAHGADTFAEQCSCGAQRLVNVNNGEREVGPWGIRTGVPGRTMLV